MEDGAVEYQVPRGGPIYHPDLVSPLTRTSEFETSVVIELQNLFSQLETNNEDISVSELKILSEEDLVEIASKDALLQIDSQIHTSLQTTTVEEKNKSKKRKNKGTKRGRQFDRDTRAAELENPSFVGKIEEVAKIKEKQDEDRVAVKLHSFSSGGGKALVENIGKMTSLKSITSSTKIRKLSNILDLYKESRDMWSKEGAEPFGSLPRSVVLVGHSMGGFVARAAIVHPRLRKGVVETVLTLSSPHQSPPVALQPSLGHYYYLVNQKWRKGYEVELTHTGRQVSEPTLSHVIVVSISGNILDYQVRSKLETLDGIVPSSH